MSSTISTRRAAQESLDSVLQENQLLHSVTECLCDMVTVTNAQGKIIWATGSIESLMGRPMRETVGLNVFELEPSGIVSRSTSVLVLKTGQGHTLLQKTCTGRQLLVSAWPVFGKNRGLEKVINISRDVTQMDRVKERLREGEVLRERVRQDWLSDRALPATSGFLTQGSKMRRVLELVHRVADVSTTVLIRGESGTGKEMVARLLHELSPRATGPFVRINCAAIPDNLLESELFGYKAGAFTGAAPGGKRGLMEVASGGTLFLDEIGELSVTLQAKLLRVLQEREIQPLGGTRPIEVDFRLVAATNCVLEAMVAEGRFRPDLYYRINVVGVTLPSLRERKEEIPLFVQHFLDRFTLQFHRLRRISPGAMEILVNHRWPGNVRELENLIESLVVTVPDEVIDVQHLPESVTLCERELEPTPDQKPFDLKRELAAVEERLVREAYRRCGSVQAAARVLGVDPSTVSRKLKRG